MLKIMESKSHITIQNQWFDENVFEWSRSDNLEISTSSKQPIKGVKTLVQQQF